MDLPEQHREGASCRLRLFHCVAFLIPTEATKRKCKGYCRSESKGPSTDSADIKWKFLLLGMNLTVSWCCNCLICCCSVSSC